MKKLRTINAFLALVLSVSLVAGCTPKAPPPAQPPAQTEARKPAESPAPPPLKNVEVVSKNGMVAAAHPLAAEAGVEVLKKGGNAIDAAVATALAVSVVEPNASGLGGGGFMLIRFAKTGETVVIDYREVAPQKATPDMYKVVDGKVVDDADHIGYKAVAVPGYVAGLSLALKKYGTMKLADVMQPAIKYAEEGITVTATLSGIIKDNFDKISKFPATAKIYLKDGLPYEAGDKLVNKDYAKTLRLIAAKGPDVFYKGEIADAIAKDMAANGGLITKADLAAYQPSIRKPVSGTYRGYEIISSPPPSSGGTHVIEILNMLENYDVKKLGHNTPDALQLWTEVIRRVFADRGKYMGDPAVVKVPLDGLLSKEYAKERAKDIDLNKAGTEVTAGDPSAYEGAHTTHLSVIDKEGNMVALTQTIECFFGSGVVVPGLGFLLNDEMDDFDVEPGRANSPGPGKKPLSSMSPTLVLKDGKPFLSVGSPGGPRIITAVAQVLSNIIDHGMSIQEAIEAARIHADNQSVYVEGRIPEQVRQALEAKGQKVTVKKEYDLYFGGAQGVLFDTAKGEFHGGADPRRDGKAVGY
ncbi:gamma-glutamyltransferase [Gelria sp. Kuro-4]|uniref:gamma-glutamyltransferase n=1 Tax=Gelria sp. Kuro-4 TaxID=2796927 RepID=UPI001BEEDCCB|nr:gamma-glutamyltransferase [Gelria sp. Kuro-4]BCV23921.1 gamma-glutamyltranspeptidase [Gelria sp. Kuro-4]